MSRQNFPNFDRISRQRASKSVKTGSEEAEDGSRWYFDGTINMVPFVEQFFRYSDRSKAVCGSLNAASTLVSPSNLFFS